MTTGTIVTPGAAPVRGATDTAAGAADTSESDSLGPLAYTPAPVVLLISLAAAPAVLFVGLAAAPGVAAVVALTEPLAEAALRESSSSRGAARTARRAVGDMAMLGKSVWYAWEDVEYRMAALGCRCFSGVGGMGIPGRISGGQGSVEDESFGGRRADFVADTRSLWPTAAAGLKMWDHDGQTSCDKLACTPSSFESASHR